MIFMHQVIMIVFIKWHFLSNNSNIVINEINLHNVEKQVLISKRHPMFRPGVFINARLSNSDVKPITPLDDLIPTVIKDEN